MPKCSLHDNRRAWKAVVDAYINSSCDRHVLDVGRNAKLFIAGAKDSKIMAQHAYRVKQVMGE